MPYNTAGLFSVVRNTAGRAMNFSFLPPHGRRMAANEEVAFYGDIREMVVRPSRFGSVRQMRALRVALDNELLAIVSTPAQVNYDVTLDTTALLTVDNGAVSMVAVSVPGTPIAAWPTPLYGGAPGQPPEGVTPPTTAPWSPEYGSPPGNVGSEVGPPPYDEGTPSDLPPTDNPPPSWPDSNNNDNNDYNNDEPWPD